MLEVRDLVCWPRFARRWAAVARSSTWPGTSAMAEEARQEMLRALDDGTELTGSYDADW
ncbi:MAG: hypothetical protein JO034_24650, partial [Singulisphaera sp.]|nr:hypothetical protein [Singulisphaera sp.]